MNAKLVKEWIRKAEEDYEGAAALIKKKGKPTPDVICFLAQQSAEKYLKAFLVSHNQKFLKTHDLMQLLTDCKKIDSSLELIHDLLNKLNPYSVSFRYPGEEASKQEAKLAVKTISEVRLFIQSKFKSI